MGTRLPLRQTQGRWAVKEEEHIRVFVNKNLTSNHQAFTLIEIAVVAVIVGILGIIAIPQVTALTNRGNSQDAVNNLLSLYSVGQDYRQSNNNYFSADPCNFDPANDDYCLRDAAGANIHTNSKYTVFSCTSGGMCTATSDTKTITLDLTQPVTQNFAVGCNGNLFNPCCSATNAGERC